MLSAELNEKFSAIFPDICKYWNVNMYKHNVQSYCKRLSFMAGVLKRFCSAATFWKSFFLCGPING